MKRRQKVKRETFDFQTLEPRHLLASVSGLWLVNADSNADIVAITDGTQIDLQTLATSNLNVRATIDGAVTNVQFSLTGPTTENSTESVAPYALFGDASGNFRAGSFAEGQYTLVVTPNSSGTDTPLAVSFDVIDDNTTPPPPTAGVYLEDNGLVVLETESTTSDLGLWEQKTDLPGFSGDGYLQFFGNTFQNGPPNSPLEYKFRIETPGLYYLHLRSRKDNSADPTRTDISNDIYVRVEGDYTSGPGPHGSHGNNGSLSLLQNDTKFFGGSLNSFKWDSGNQLDPGGHMNKRVAVYNFKAGEEYTLVVSGRSKFYNIDRIVFRHEDTSVSLAQNLNTPESELSGPADGEDGDGSIAISGELKKWHKSTLTLDGPAANEGGAINPFTDYRLNVTFTHPLSGTTYVVPGYFAADGDAANTGATSGRKWRAHLAADQEGVWNYSVSFRAGNNVATNASATAGTALAPYDGVTGQFTIDATDKTGDDFRGKGRLEYVGEHYLQFAETGEYFIKQGTDSPENLLAYADFDGGFKSDGVSDSLIKTWSPHVDDWNQGDPTWSQVDGAQGTHGKGLIGAINYLASEELNAVSFLTMNIEGDDRNVFPYTTYSQRDRLDVSKLDQWEIVFEHGDRKGMYLHFKTQETENDQLLDGGALGNQRKLYYRELIARYSHHLGLNWNLGEENSNTTQQVQDFAQYFYGNDPYQNHVVLHTYPAQKDQVYTPLLGDGSKLTGLSLQTNREDFSNVHVDTATWVSNSANAGKKWVVAVDEPGEAQHALRPDNDAGNSHIDGRKNALWGTLMAGGAGNEWYFGYGHEHSDLTAEDFRSRDAFWDYTRYAKSFFENNDIPFWEMRNDNSISSAADDYGFYKPGELYTVYLKNGGSTNLDLSGVTGAFDVSWFDPRNGGDLQQGSVTQVQGGGTVSLGQAPNTANQDWAILVTQGELAAAPEITLFVRDGQLADTINMLDRPDQLQTLSALFDQTVEVNINDLTLTHVSTGEPVNLSAAGFAYYSQSNVATWDLEAVTESLPAGYYLATISATGVTAASTGLGLSTDYTQVIYKAIPGDVNLDGKVDVLGDGFALVENIGVNAGANWTDGDFNNDGAVDVLEDAFVLVNNLGRTLTIASSNLFAQSTAAPPESRPIPLATETRDIAFTNDYSWTETDEDQKRTLSRQPNDADLVDQAFESDSIFQLS